MHKRIAKWMAGACLLGLPAAQAVPIYESDQVTLYMQGYFSVNQVNVNGDTSLQDGISRIRFSLSVPAYRQWDVGFNVEWGINAISSARRVEISGNQQAAVGDAGDTLYIRHGHAFAKHDLWGDFAFGKQWGIYYDVASYTDWYEISGGLASGAYSLGTDGGITGTGRADGALTWRKEWEGLGGELRFGAQYQAHTSPFDVSVVGVVGEDLLLECPGNDCEFGISHGVSLQYRADIGQGLTLGTAYNRVKLDLETTRGIVTDISDPFDPVIIDTNFAISASSNIWSLIAGVNYGRGPYQPGFYAAAVLQKSQNNDLAPPGSVEGITNFFDAIGSESLFTYTWGARNCYSFYFGHNNLHSNDPGFEEALIDADEVRLTKYYIGFKYNWDERIHIYTENTIDNSNSLGRALTAGDVIAVGMRVDI